MQVTEKFFPILLTDKKKGPLLDNILQQVSSRLSSDEVPVRFIVTESHADQFDCETGILDGVDAEHIDSLRSKVTTLKKRRFCNETAFNVAMLIPTGVGAELGGHSGDGGAAARLLAQTCDTLITHPNVVNGADLNELPDNGLYAEGSLITRLMMGNIALQKTRGNRILVIVDRHKYEKYQHATINMVSAARAAAGYNISGVVMLDEPLEMESHFTKSGRAAGKIRNLEQIFSVLEKRKGEYDAVAVASVIVVPKEYHSDYFRPDCDIAVNPWGGVEAMLTHAISTVYDVPSAHAPMMSSPEVQNLDLGIVDPRKAAEAVSLTYFFCVLKGLHRSPRIITPAPEMSHPGLISASDVHCLVIPDGCVGIPTIAAIEQGIPVIAVRGNRNIMKNDLSTLPFAKGGFYSVDNYLEAAGLITALRAGICPSAVIRPISQTPYQKESDFN